MHRRWVFSGLGIFLGLATAIATLAAAPIKAAEPEYTFTIHHFLSPKAPAQTTLIEPWAERIAAASEGRIAFEIFPSMTLGGKPPELYKQVRDGTADIVWTVPGYTPGVFPRLEVFELPTVHRGSAEATTLAIQDVMPDLEADLQDVKPLLVHVHSGNALHLVNLDVNGPDDVKDLKIRSPSRTGVWMLESWGAEPVGMPVPALPQALSKGTIDGALIPFEVAIPLKIAQLAEHSVELDGGRRFGTATFLLAMNKERYENLPDDLKKIIDDNSGAAIAGEIGAAWDSIEPVGKQIALDQGRNVYALSPEATAAFDSLHQGLSDRWVEEASEKGIDAEALLDKARAAVASHSD
ncbi:MAG: TRAP transporter substrate-binding protein [Rhodospirillales bacterium]|nr:TRAP transporter substrate-binding protein [Rhodospirillales bacterium]